MKKVQEGMKKMNIPPLSPLTQMGSGEKWGATF
jgi:hypothetical protein